MINLSKLAFLFLIIGFSCNPPANTDTGDRKSQNENFFPFTLSKVEGRYMIAAFIEEGELYPKYFEFFEKHGYLGNGPCWQGHIVNILKKENPELLNHIEFDPEAGAFFSYVDTEKNQLKIARIISPIFADLKKLETYVKQANRSSIDD